jgi:hypothetical protein
VWSQAQNAFDVKRGWCPGRELNPHSPCGKTDFKSVASADFATRAYREQKLIRLRRPGPDSLRENCGESAQIHLPHALTPVPRFGRWMNVQLRDRNRGTPYRPHYSEGIRPGHRSPPERMTSANAMRPPGAGRAPSSQTRSFSAFTIRSLSQCFPTSRSSLCTDDCRFIDTADPARSQFFAGQQRRELRFENSTVRGFSAHCISVAGSHRGAKSLRDGRKFQPLTSRP